MKVSVCCGRALCGAPSTGCAGQQLWQQQPSFEHERFCLLWQGFVRSTTKYWVRTTDVSAVKHHVLQHLPVFQYNVGDENQQDSQLINSVYLDNSSMELYHGRLDKRPNAIALRIRSATAGLVAAMLGFRV